MAELAACSDSICIVPVPVVAQFLDDEHISNIIELTEIKTFCASRATIGVLLDLKSKGKI